MHLEAGCASCIPYEAQLRQYEEAPEPNARRVLLLEAVASHRRRSTSWIRDLLTASLWGCFVFLWLTVCTVSYHGCCRSHMRLYIPVLGPPLHTQQHLSSFVSLQLLECLPRIPTPVPRHFQAHLVAFVHRQHLLPGQPHRPPGENQFPFYRMTSRHLWS